MKNLSSTNFSFKQGQVEYEGTSECDDSVMISSNGYMTLKQLTVKSLIDSAIESHISSAIAKDEMDVDQRYNYQYSISNASIPSQNRTKGYLQPINENEDTKVGYSKEVLDDMVARGYPKVTGENLRYNTVGQNGGYCFGGYGVKGL